MKPKGHTTHKPNKKLLRSYRRKLNADWQRTWKREAESDLRLKGR